MKQPFKWTILAIILIILAFSGLLLGSVHIPAAEILSIFLNSEPVSGAHSHIILDLRLPRIITAILAGAALSVSGMLMQTLFRNPLAGPFVLGISSGASLGVAFLILAGSGLSIAFIISGWAQAIAAASGAVAVLLLTLTIAMRIRDVMSLLIIGLMFGSLTGAIVSLLQFFSTGEEIQLFLMWTFGSLGGLDYNELKVLVIFVVAGLSLAFIMIKPLNAFLLGERYAESMGIPIARIRIIVILSTGLLAGAVTAFCGPIAFIGLAIPHFTRLFFKTSSHQILIPGCMFIGSIAMLLCDLLAQLPGSQYVLPINAVTSLIGSPVVIWLVLKRGNLSKAF
ncbi:iron ABC transporter permease [Fulvivirga sedimenti]|uniref:Iron ABC transporter permease n=1 Tax=Fulvivirga sedimenti TaxID=2879465 RepID=A0A9X1KYZ6_9BACT|nr:iron ABC transporter permease [Fulvivirga sedimenti]MCA6074131.1 iron ABC transporter permease [Fulvivirga sedimenti]